VAEIAKFRARLVSSGRQSEKRINNILVVLSKALKYAVEAEVIDHAPRIGLFRVEAPEIVSWEIDEYVRLLAAAQEEGSEWYVAACLAGEAGLRIGEVRALRWKEDVDLTSQTITVNQQTRHGVTGTPKGRTRRVVPMTSTLFNALKGLSVVRSGYVVRNEDGSPLSDNQTKHTIYRICDRAGLKADRYLHRTWHVLRHTFGTHAALFGVNPWRLQAWMGHKQIDETVRYVHVADAHRRDLPEPVVAAAARETDPDKRIIAMLGARAQVVASDGHSGECGHQVGTSAQVEKVMVENYC
jgi:integrase